MAICPRVVSSTARNAASSAAVSVLNGGTSGGGLSRIRTVRTKTRSAARPSASTGVSEIFVTTSMPAATCPHIECCPSRPGWSTTQMKNCEPLLSGRPAAITAETAPRTCRASLSSASRSPSPPRP